MPINLVSYRYPGYMALDMAVFLVLVVVYIRGLTAVTTDCPGILDSEPPGYFNFNECVRSGSLDCTYSVRIRPNPENDSFVDFFLETTASGYAAVGFSKNKRMPSTDVLGCGRNAKGALRVRDTWNHDYYNEDDPNQDGVCVHSISYENNMLKCSFSRYAAVINNGHDFNLNDTYYLILAYSDNRDSSTNFPSHSIHNLPRVNDRRVNVYADSSESYGTSGGEEMNRWLIQVHGILMTVAWPFLAVIGIFISTWTKPAFPTGQWFQFHRALMVSSVVVALIAFILVIVANKESSTPGLIVLSCNRNIAHLIIGVTTIALQLLNPLIALCRCKPNSKHRVIFNLIHGSGVGIFTELLALVNVGLGIALFESNCGPLSYNHYILWVYILWVAFFLIFQIGLSFVLWFHSVSIVPLVLQLLFTSFRDRTVHVHNKAYNQLNDVTDDASDSSEETDHMRRRKSSWKEDNTVRSKALGMFILVNLGGTAVIVVLIAMSEGV